MIKRCIFIMLLFVCGLCIGCSDHAEPEQKENEGRMELTIAIWDAEEVFQGDAVLEKIEEKFNIDIKPVNVTWDDYYPRIEQFAATGDLPDIFVGDFRDTSMYTQWIEQGLLCAIPEDLSSYPYLDKYMSEAVGDQVAKVEGKTYCIPRLTYPSQEWTCLDRIIAYRWDLVQKAGITKEPETWDEFQEMILTIMKEDPDGTEIHGMITNGAGLISGILLPYASPISVIEGTSFYWKMDEDGVYKPVYFIDDLTGAFQLGRDMYMTGVIDKDVILQTTQSAREKFLRGENAAILYSGGYAGEYDRLSMLWKDYHENDYLEDVKALKLMPDENGNKTYPMWGYAWSESYINANVDEAKLDVILQLYDYILSDEGAIYTTYGPEGDCYEMVNGKVQLLDDEVSVLDKYPSTRGFSILARWYHDKFDDRFLAPYPEEYKEVNQELVEEAKDITIPSYEIQCTNIMKEQKIDFSINVQDDFTRIMIGTEPVDQMWSEIKEEYENNGLQQVIDEVNEEMQKYEDK